MTNVERRVFHSLTEDDEGDVVVALHKYKLSGQTVWNEKTYQCKPGEDKVKELVYHLHMDPELPKERV